MIWIPIVTVVGGGAFAFYVYRSVQLPERAAQPGVAVDAYVSEAQRWADAQTGRFEGLLGTFAERVRAGRVAEAYAELATGYRSLVPLERFEPAVRANAWLASSQGVDVRRIQSIQGTTRVEGILRSGVGNVELVANFTEEAGTSRMTGLQLGGMPALPGP